MRALFLVVLALVLAGCADNDSVEETTNSVTVTLPATSTGRVYWLRDGKVWPAARNVDASDDPAEALLDELLAGPADNDESWGAETAVPDGTELTDPVVDDGVAHLNSSSKLSDEARAQVVYTLTQFPDIDSVEIELKVYTRADFEEQTPSVLVESPLPFEEVTSPLRAEGTANTFEATFNYELTDTDGLIVDENFVTATSGTGTRGTFDFTTKPYTVPFDGMGSLIVFERSAEDGSRIHLVEIPVRMTR